MSEESTYLQAAKSGDVLAFRSLVDDHKDFVFTLAFRMLHQRETAEEIAQDVFVKMHRKLSTFREDAALKTWLYTITYRTCVDQLRKKKIKQTSLDRDDAFFQLKDSAALKPDRILEKQEKALQIKKAIEKLKPQDAAIITLFYFNDKNVEEIAKAVGISKSNVKVRLFRLRENLRKELWTLGAERGIKRK